MTGSWLSVIGIEDNGLASLSEAALELIRRADAIFGGERHFAMLGNHTTTQHRWQSPFSKSIAEIKARKGENVVVLATGDPLWFGVGAVLLHHFTIGEMRMIPARSSFSLAASSIGWPLASVQTLTLHGQPFSSLARYVCPNTRLLILSRDRHTPAEIATFLDDHGFGQSGVQVMEHLGGGNERIRQSTAAGFDLREVADLNIVAVECIAGPDARWFSTVPGLPDCAFHHDGQLTKSIVRAASLAALRPQPGALLWDVGAGCGSIGIEWMRATCGAKAIAIELDQSRCDLIAKNAENLGVPGLQIITGKAPSALEGLSAPNAIFIGGGLTGKDVFETCWQSLLIGGRLVANGVTLESEVKLIELHRHYGGTLSRISVEQASPMGKFRGWKQAKPVIQWQVVKPGSGL